MELILWSYPNGYGSISKTQGKRRKPYRVYVTTGWDETGKQIKESLGYVKSYKEGLDVLSDYHHDPYDLNYKNLTFADVWRDVDIQLEELVEANKMSESNLKGLRNAYKNHCIPLYNDKILELRKKKMQYLIDNIDGGSTLKGNVKTVCVKIFTYAFDEYELPVKLDYVTTLKIGEKKTEEEGVPFTEEELSLLWDLKENDIVKTLLIICYTGMRPNELFNMSRENIHLNEEYMFGGSKTDAGKNRIIPIHPRIKFLIEYFLNNDKQYPFKYLKEINKQFNYGKYGRAVKKLMDNIGLDHKPYDGRHTFSTRMKKAKADEYILKRIIGHSIQDLTEKVYTHRDISELIEEVKKIT